MPTIKSPTETESIDNAKLYVWIKSLETKVNSLLRETDLLKNDTLKKNNERKREIKILQQDILEVKRQQEKTQRTMDLMIQELKNTAGIEEIMVLRKYIEYWNPLTFVTQRDVQRIIDASLKIKQEAVKAKQEQTNTITQASTQQKT